MSEDNHVILDDSALAKISLERLGENRQRIEGKNKQQEEMVRNDLDSKDYENRSYSSVTGGGTRKNFAKEK